jgi:putative ABC transport system permease protein
MRCQVEEIFSTTVREITLALMSSLLFRTAVLDPLTFAAVSALLIVAATLASYVPARRATELNPLEALRTE